MALFEVSPRFGAFQFKCVDHTGPIVETKVENENHAVIEILFMVADLRSFINPLFFIQLFISFQFFGKIFSIL